MCTVKTSSTQNTVLFSQYSPLRNNSLTTSPQHAPGAEGAADQGADGDGDEPDDPAQLPDRQAPREGRQPPHRGQAARPGGREHFQVPQPLVLTAPVNSFN